MATNVERLLDGDAVLASPEVGAARAATLIDDLPDPCPEWCTDDHAAVGFDCHGPAVRVSLPGEPRYILHAGLYRCWVTGETTVEVYTYNDGEHDPSADLNAADAAEFAADLAQFGAEVARLAEQLRAWKAAGNR